MKFKIYEPLLNEYVDHVSDRLVDEVEATSFEEAYKIAKVRHPQLLVMKIDDGNTSIDYNG